MFLRRGLVLAIATAVGLSFAVAAQAEPPAGKPAEFHLYKASAITAMRVYNPAGEDLGKISDLVMDAKDGKVAYCVLSYGGVAGVGAKMFAVPCDALAMHEKDKTQYFVLNMDQAKLEKATGFRNEDWPTEADRSFSAAPKAGEGKGEEAVRKVKDAAKDLKDDAREAVGGKREIFRTSAVIGTKVKSANGEDLGKINDLVFDTKAGKLSYAVLAHGGVAGVGSKWFAIGWDCFKLDSTNLKPNDRAFICSIDKAVLESAEGFTNDNWPHGPDKRFAKKPAIK